ncbi:MAG: hypothetical protein IJ314_02855 [Bacteroidales bacterium]|nr:hypothetical protein [Bacteroidales bacterium]
MRHIRIIASVVAFCMCCCVLDLHASPDTLSVAKGNGRSGFDAGKMVGAGRYRPKAHTEFVNDRFSDNLSLTLDGIWGIPRSDDYGFPTGARLSLLKGISPSVAVRLNLGGGYVYYNRNASRLSELSASVSGLFNLSSYILGYDRTRFCELSTVIGLGYSYTGHMVPEHFFVADIGLNVNMRVSDRFSISVEPCLPIHLNGKGLAYGFSAGIGVGYDFSRNALKPSGAGKYFISLMGGGQFQNSSLVRETGIRNSLGMHYSVGFGRIFKDFFALRFSAAYSHDIWAEYYGGFKMPAKYYALRMEALFDILRLATRKSSNLRFGLGLVAGPEFGYMSKVDIESELGNHYVGIGMGVRADCRLCKWMGLFVEPRYSIIPYPASNDVPTSSNAYRNYFDSLFNFNAGIEIYL